MDYFEINEKERKEKEIFEEAYRKQLKATKTGLVAMFFSFFVLFAVIGLSIYLTESEEQTAAIVFEIVSGVSFFIGVIFSFVEFKVPDYKKYKEKQKKNPGYITFDILTRIEILERRIEELEKDRN